MISSDAFGYVNMLDNASDVSWQRQTLILNNIANNDTPGYKRQDIEFESVLRNALIGTHERTLDRAVDVLDDDNGLDRDGRGVEGVQYTDYENFSYRLDGNNVDMDTENVELATEQIRYQALSASLINELGRFETAIGR
ncbi:MAG: flagellar basal body rod protein FlgB [Pseudobutyrivibrio sp.]|nr:flagellar basal body rod protein FlgB [Pseudobutyrivibrio sp.]